MPAGRLNDWITQRRTTSHEVSTTKPCNRNWVRKRSNIPPILQDSIPTCAQSCLQNYITEQFASCSTHETVECLCTQYSKDGYTLGELAFICLQEECSSPPFQTQQAAYAVCQAQAGAAQATHSTLTIPATATATATYSTTTKTTTTSVSTTASATVMVTKPQLLSPTPSTPATMSTSYLSVTSNPSATSVTTSASPTAQSQHPFSTLTSAQAAGVSVGAFGALVTIGMIIWLSLCLRRRRGQGKTSWFWRKQDSFIFCDKEPTRFHDHHFGYPPPGNAQMKQVFGGREQNRHWDWNQWSDQQPDSKLKGLRLVPSSHSLATDQPSRSNETLRPHSLLLRERPGQTPPQLQSKQFSQPRGVASPETLFEEYRTSCVPSTHDAKVPRLPLRIRPNGLPGKHIAQRPQFATQYTGSPKPIQQPALSLQVPPTSNKSVVRVPSPVAALPRPPKGPRGDRRSWGSRSGSSGRSKSGGSVLEYYASPDIDREMNSLGSPLMPVSTEAQKRETRPLPEAITVTKPTYPPLRGTRRPSRESAGSDTSFESNDPDEPTPPEEDKQLSPVAEHSPIAAVRYPKVPRSSNQSIPRTPPLKVPSPSSPKPRDDRTTLPSHIRNAALKTPERRPGDDRDLSGTTLLVKRRGDVVAHDLEKGLKIAVTAPRSLHHQRQVATPPKMPASKSRQQDSPLKGYGRLTSTGSARPTRQQTSDFIAHPVAAHTPQNVGLKSPQWEPKLTPSRRGEDLFLQVGMMSPGVKGEAAGYYGTWNGQAVETAV